jgi:hypothetical protein
MEKAFTKEERKLKMDRRTFFKMLGVAGVFGFSEITAKAQPENELYKYSKFIHRGDEATMDEFRNIFIIDEKGLNHHVPLIWADDKKAVEVTTNEYCLQKDDNIIVDRIRLPLLNLNSFHTSFDGKNIHSHYRLTASALYKDDTDQIVEQILSKFGSECDFVNNTGSYRLSLISNNCGEVNKVQKWSFNFILKLDGMP